MKAKMLRKILITVGISVLVTSVITITTPGIEKDSSGSASEQQ